MATFNQIDRPAQTRTGTVRVIDLERLRRDWRRQQMEAEAKQTDRGLDTTMRRVLAMQARMLHVCGTDLDDILQGKEHPSARRPANK